MSKKKKQKNNSHVIEIPKDLLKPVGSYLKDQVKTLEKRKQRVEKEDPFADTERLTDNASPDTDAAEQFGHATVSAIRNELERKIIQTKKAMSRVWIGKYGICEDCGNMIDTDRLMIYPEATLCAKCQKKREK